VERTEGCEVEERRRGMRIQEVLGTGATRCEEGAGRSRSPRRERKKEK